MVWIYSVVSGESRWPCGTTCRQSHTVKTTSLPKPPSSPECRTANSTERRSGMTSRPLTIQSSPNYPLPLTSSSPASPASRSVARGLERVWRATNPASSLKFYALPTTPNANSSSSKTHPPSETRAASTEFFKNLPRTGMMQDGRVCPHLPWERPTTAIGGGCSQKGSKRKRKHLWPTPCARADSTSGGTQFHLHYAVRMWPHQQPPARLPKTRQAYKDHVAIHGKTRGGLNPAFLEWLMGYPTKWTECMPWATVWYRNKRGPRSKNSLVKK